MALTAESALFYLLSGVDEKPRVGGEPTFDREGVKYGWDPPSYIKQMFKTPVTEDVELPDGSKVPAMLLERSSENLLLWSNDFSNAVWTTTAPPVVTAQPSGVFAGEVGYKIEDDDGAANELVEQAAGAMSTSTETFSVIAERGTADEVELLLREGSTIKARVRYTWSTGAVTVVTGAGGVRVLGPGLIRLWCSAAGSGGTRNLQIFPAGTNTNTGYTIFHHAQHEVQPGPTSPMVTGAASASRVVETLVYDRAPSAQDMMVFIDMVEQGVANDSGAGFLLEVADASRNTPRWSLRHPSGTDDYEFIHENGTSNVSRTLSVGAVASVGDRVRLVGHLKADGAVSLGYEINDDGAASGPYTGTLTLNDWSENRMSVGIAADLAISPGIWKIHAIKIVKGGDMTNTNLSASPQAVIDELTDYRLNPAGVLIPT